MAALEQGALNAPINGAPVIGDGKVHGQIGMTVGSNGLRAIDGTMVAPLGENGQVALSFVQASGGIPRARRGHR